MATSSDTPTPLLSEENLEKLKVDLATAKTPGELRKLVNDVMEYWKQDVEKIEADHKILTDKFAPDYPCAIFNDKAIEAYKKLKEENEKLKEEVEVTTADLKVLQCIVEPTGSASFFNAKASEEFAKLKAENEKLKKENSLLEFSLEHPEGDEREYLTKQMIAETKKAMKLQEENEKLKAKVEELQVDRDGLAQAYDDDDVWSDKLQAKYEKLQAENERLVKKSELACMVSDDLMKEKVALINEHLHDDDVIDELKSEVEKLTAEVKKLTNPSWVLDHHPALKGKVVMDEDDYTDLAS